MYAVEVLGPFRRTLTPKPLLSTSLGDHVSGFRVFGFRVSRLGWGLGFRAREREVCLIVLTSRDLF